MRSLRIASFLGLAALLQACAATGGTSTREADAADIIHSIAAPREQPRCPAGTTMLCTRWGSRTIRDCGCVTDLALSPGFAGVQGP
ncbi:MAG TPA: hypothetical protein VJ011_11605 [Steroidobacteraceae bacterium]|nr:hypothetical protein [Steroidobacteraceae bacterium]